MTPESPNALVDAVEGTALPALSGLDELGGYAEHVQSLSHCAYPLKPYQWVIIEAARGES